MPVSLNHTIVPAMDNRASAEFLAGILGLELGTPFGPFVPVRVTDSLMLDYAPAGFADRGVTTISPHHYAFQVEEAEFDEIFERIEAAGLDYYAEPHEPHRFGEVNTWRGAGRSVYFDDPNGHIMEVMTAPDR